MRMGDLYKTAEGKEKHVPIIDLLKGEGKAGKDIVKVVVGKDVPHPNLTEHHIVWIELFGVKTDGNVIDIGRAVFGPGYTEPSACFHVSCADFKALVATSYCNIHGVWESTHEL